KQQYISLAQTADALLTDIRDEQLMPFDTGNLQNDSTHVDDSQQVQGRVSVVSTTPYARRLYFHPEYDFRRTNNARAGGQWFEPYISGSKKEWIVDTFKKLFKRNGGL
ncbi:MAG: hypothetical protein IKW21_00605, partial [Lachnospiraceae bacterium]|nr:hypothetical protein [Lachnospiraceae bacterium]